jgi:hypothetical protein
MDYIFIESVKNLIKFMQSVGWSNAGIADMLEETAEELRKS